jgi:HEAT repeat protein
MARRPDRTKEELDALRAASRLDPTQAREVLRGALTSTSNLVVARAAEIAGELEDQELAGELAQTYWRLAADPFELDKGCLGMKAILGALFALEADAADVYTHAVRHVQFDSGTFSEDPIDSAAELRGVAAHALIRTEHPNALEEIAPLLLDERGVRLAAVRALRAASSHAATLLLRMSLLMREGDPEICFECFAGLLDYGGDSLEYVASFLGHEDSAVASMAALAIGEHGGGDALERLKAAWYEQTNPDLREALLNAMASVRSDEAAEFLIGLVRGEAMTAITSLGVLSRFRSDARLVERIRVAAKANNRKPVLAAFESLFE